MARVSNDAAPIWPVWGLGGALWAGLMAWGMCDTTLMAGDVQVVELGKWGLRLLITSFAVTPLSRAFRMPSLMRYRREFGLLAYLFIAGHVVIYLYRWQIWPHNLGYILQKFYLTVGLAAFVLVTPLAITSHRWARRAMGRKYWRGLHCLIYPVMPLCLLHEALYPHNDYTEITLHWLAVIACFLERGILLQERHQIIRKAKNLTITPAALFGAAKVESDNG